MIVIIEKKTKQNVYIYSEAQEIQRTSWILIYVENNIMTQK